MTRAEETSRSDALGAKLEWPSEEDAPPMNGLAGGDRADGRDQSPARSYFLGTPPGGETEELSIPGAAQGSPRDLDRVLRDSALRFEHLVESTQAELQDAVAAHVTDLEQTLVTGTAELNHAADQRLAELEEAIDARLEEMQQAAVNDRIAILAARVTKVGRLATVAAILSILALGAALVAMAAALS
jgi:hypothetical protein